MLNHKCNIKGGGQSMQKLIIIRTNQFQFQDLLAQRFK